MTRPQAPQAPRHELGARARLAWDALQGALDTERPGCHGDARFTRDNLSDAQVATLAQICTACPILRACDAFAAALPIHAVSGVWAGRRRGRVLRPDYRPRVREEVAS